ncbi:MFS transporter [Serratia fonticola]|nr:MFS transporter [Serratia fonticola]NTZ11533.1 MFS transporter [Serratia fonticola]
MRSRDEVATGLLLRPWPLAIIVMTPIAGRLVGRDHTGLLEGLGRRGCEYGLFCFCGVPSDAGDGYRVGSRRAQATQRPE